jgi:hypothetical protein
MAFQIRSFDVNENNKFYKNTINILIKFVAINKKYK